MRTNKHGFTLIELIIVLIIIGILSTIAAPMMGGMKARVICAEAVTGMAAIRTAMMQYKVEYGDWAAFYGKGLGLLNSLSASDFALYYPGLDINNLTGTYFGKENYYVDGSNIYCHAWAGGIPGQASSAARWQEAGNVADSPMAAGDKRLIMDYRTGKISQQGISKSGY